MFIGNDKIRETVNCSDSDGGNFSQISERATRAKNIHPSVAAAVVAAMKRKFSKPEPDRDRKKTLHTQSPLERVKTGFKHY
jgi:hypothetical protein